MYTLPLCSTLLVRVKVEIRLVHLRLVDFSTLRGGKGGTAYFDTFFILLFSFKLRTPLDIGTKCESSVV